MKTYLYIILLALFILIPVNISAEGYISVSPSSLTIEQGSSKTFIITAYNTIGDVSISSNNTQVASANTSEWGTGMVDEKQTKSGTITVTGNSVGTTTITLVIDAATFDSEDLAGQTRTVSINVVAKPTPEISQPIPDSTPIQKPTSEISQPAPNYPVNNLSDNNNIKELSIDGFELIKVDDTKYTLSVGNHINKLNIKATLEDNKSKIEGIGEKELSVGQNDFVITVTAENGSVKQYHILITRRDDKYYLKDIDDFIKSDSDTLLLLENDVVTEQIISKLKPLNKEIKFAKLNSNNEVLYEFTINTKNLNKRFNTDILFESKNSIDEKTNYAQGLSLVIDKNIPKGSKLNVYLNNKFVKGDLINIYKYSNGKLSLVDTTKIESKYLLFELSNSEEYFITKANLLNSKCDSSDNKTILIVSIIIVFIIILTLLYLLLRKQNSNKRNNKLNENQDERTNNNIEEFDINHSYHNELQVNSQRNIGLNQVENINSSDNYTEINKEISTSNKEDILEVNDLYQSQEKETSNENLNIETKINNNLNEEANLNYEGINKIKEDIDNMKNRYF